MYKFKHHYLWKVIVKRGKCMKHVCLWKVISKQAQVYKFKHLYLWKVISKQRQVYKFKYLYLWKRQTYKVSVSMASDIQTGKFIRHTCMWKMISPKSKYIKKLCVCQKENVSNSFVYEK